MRHLEDKFRIPKRLFIFISRNPLDLDDEAIKFPLMVASNDEFAVYESILFSMGFTRTDDHSDIIFLPCPLGTFANASAKEKGMCIEYPPGMS